MTFLKNLSSDSIPVLDDISNAVQTLQFTIPDQVFQAFDTLTRVVGYIMPLRLYTPIITLILGYWFIMIAAAFAKFLINLLKLLPAIFGMSK